MTLVVFCGFTVYMAIIVVLHVFSLVALAAVLCTATYVHIYVVVSGVV